jgi:hypothetical protein
MGNSSSRALGPAEPERKNPADAVSLPEPKAQPRADGLTSVMDAAAAAIPHVQKVMGAIKTATEVYEALKGKPVEMEKGESKPLAPYIKPTNQEQLDRVLRYKMATLLVADLMRIGKMAGIDFSTWMGGLPPPDQTPAAKEPAAGNKREAAAPDDAAAPEAAPPRGAPERAPSPPAAAARNPRAEMLMNQLNGLTIDDLKSRAKIWMNQLIEKNTRTLGKQAGPVAMNKWHWNGANENGFGEAINWDGAPRQSSFTPDGYDPDHDKRTAANIAWYLRMASVPDGTMAGLPDEVTHFDPMTIESTPLQGLGWFTGGSCETWYLKAPGDDIKVDIHGTDGTPEVGRLGGYQMRFEFWWDNAKTTMHCGVTAVPEIAWPIAMDVSVEGTPET